MAKFNMLWEAKWNEIEAYAWVSMVLGMAMLLVGIFWDQLAGSHVNHSEGFGLGQILWCALWGLYTFYGWGIQDKWGE